MKKSNRFMRLSLLLLGSLGSLSVLALPLTPEEALQRISVNSPTGIQKRIPMARPQYVRPVKTSAGTQAIYLFDYPNQGGYLILSADDRFSPVLGYSDKGNLSDENLPDGLRWWLNSIADEISAVIDSNAEIIKYSDSAPAEATEPVQLVQTKWGQTDPYNKYTPVISEKQSPTGCVATALSQVMNYYQWPPAPVGEVTYEDTSKPKNTYSMVYDGITFNWDAMLPEYDEESSEESIDAVATLMKAVGYGVHMTYGASSSGATDANAIEAMKNFFKYSSDVHHIRRESFLREEWDNMLYSQLKAGMPLYYTGRDAVWLGSGGHAFVCDGYDGNGYFHFNWGWNDKYNGYFLTSCLTPAGAGTGGYINGYNYTQSVFVNMHPDDGKEYDLYDFVIGSKFSLSSNFSSVSATLSRGLNEGEFEVGLSLNPSDDKEAKTYIALGTASDGSKTWQLTEPLTSGLDSEKAYDLRMVWRENGENDWRRLPGISDGLLVYNQTPMGGTLSMDGQTWKFNAELVDLPEVKTLISDIKINDDDYYIAGASNKYSFHLENQLDDFVHHPLRCYVKDSKGNEILFFNTTMDMEPEESSTHTYSMKANDKITAGEYTFRFIDVVTLQEIPCDKEYSMKVFDDTNSKTFDDGSFCYTVLDDGRGLLTKTVTGSSLSGDIHIPASVTYEDREYVLSTIIPSLSSIVNKQAVTSIRIDYPFTELPGSSFSSCTELKELILPPTIRRIGKYAGAFNKKMITLVLPDELDFMDEYAFGACNALENVNIPVMDTIPPSAFYSPQMLNEIVIPEGVKVIGDKAFQYNKNLERIVLPSTLENVGPNAFSSYFSPEKDLKEVKIFALTPPDAISSAFSSGSYKSATLKVPGGTKNDYLNHPVWSKFNNIEEFQTTTGIDEIEDSSAAYVWYTIDGQRLFQQPTTPGIYIRVSSNGQSLKVAM